MHTQNVNTAASESTKTWSERLNTRGLPAALADVMEQLITLAERKERMMADERSEQIYGCLWVITQKVCDSVSDWSIPRPKIPAAVVSAWLLAREMVIAWFGQQGEEIWAHAVRRLKDKLICGYAHP